MLGAVKFTLIMQLALTASVEPHGLLLVGNPKLVAFVPVKVMPMPVSAAVPVLVSVTVCADVVVPLVTEVKPRTEPESEAIGDKTATAVPVSDAICGEFEALSITETVPRHIPAAKPGFEQTEVGVKLTENVQLAPAASVAGRVPQLLV